MLPSFCGCEGDEGDIGPTILTSWSFVLVLHEEEKQEEVGKKVGKKVVPNGQRKKNLLPKERIIHTSYQGKIVRIISSYVVHVKIIFFPTMGPVKLFTFSILQKTLQ